MSARAFLGLAVILIAGCNAPAQPGRMRIDTANAPAGFPAALRDAVCIGRVSGGDPGNARWSGSVNNAEFRQALSDSLESSGLLAQPRAQCRYTIDADLVSLSRPDISFEIDVIANVGYRVTASAAVNPARNPPRRPSAPSTPLLQETVSSRFSAGFSDSPVGITRLQRATEGAIRENIRTLLEKLRTMAPR